MLIKKGGIYRNIDDRRLAEYQERGFAQAATEDNRPAGEPEGEQRPDVDGELEGEQKPGEDEKHQRKRQAKE